MRFFCIPALKSAARPLAAAIGFFAGRVNLRAPGAAVADHPPVSSGALSNIRLQYADRAMGRSPVARPIRVQIALIAVSLLSLSGLTACVGSASGLVQQPAFELNSSTGLVGVNIRQPLPGRTDNEFETLVKSGMLQALPASTVVTPLTAPFPERRLVWHVSLDVPHGTSRLILNMFDGPRVVAYDQEHIGSDASSAEILAAIESMTQRLVAQSAVHSPD